MPQKIDITEDTLFSSVRELGNLVRGQKVTSLALTEAYLDRLEKLGPKLNAVVTVTRDLALKEAKQADPEIKDGKYRGPLHGIPYGVKDLAAVRGYPTTWGAQPFRTQVFDWVGWRSLFIREPALDLRVTPVLPDQELDTRRSTSMVYWEGEQTVVGTSNGQPIAGQGYVELVGYGQ